MDGVRQTMPTLTETLRFRADSTRCCEKSDFTLVLIVLEYPGYNYIMLDDDRVAIVDPDTLRGRRYYRPCMNENTTRETEIGAQPGRQFVALCILPGSPYCLSIAMLLCILRSCGAVVALRPQEDKAQNGNKNISGPRKPLTETQRGSREV
jgi:hypothetical protein